MKKYISVAIGVLIVSCVFSPKKQTTMNELLPNDWAELQTQTSGSIILDVRTEEEFESGYIAGAKNLDIRGGADFISSIEELDKSKAYFVYCRSGARSARACAVMQQYGFSLAFNLLGGILDWKGDTE